MKIGQKVINSIHGVTIEKKYILIHNWIILNNSSILSRINSRILCYARKFEKCMHTTCKVEYLSISSLTDKAAELFAQKMNILLPFYQVLRLGENGSECSLSILILRYCDRWKNFVEFITYRASEIFLWSIRDCTWARVAY